MCGIAGFFNYLSRRPALKKSVVGVLESMRYRGPDSLGIYEDSDIVMGNVRLAIQGITQEGNQPIFNEDKSVVVVYNGEIYNFPELREQLRKKGHSFYTETDTEILVHLYEDLGTDMAQCLNGMFAFALFDRKKRMLVLARDRTAQKPLYISRNSDGIFFSSELKSMIPYLDSCSIDPVSVRTFLSIGYALEPRTILNEVNAIEPGSLCVLTYAGESIKKFWQVVNGLSDTVSDLREWKQKADVVIRAAVRRHLVSDVPVTLLLSGGVDSSLLAVYLREEGRIKKAYTGSFIDHNDHDEYSFALALAKYCRFEIERVCLSDRMLADNLEDFLDKSSMPQGDYSGLATFCMAREISKEYRVVLGGDGGDELFGGYPTYTFPYLSGKYSFAHRRALRLAHYLAARVANKRRYLSLAFKLQQLSLAWGEHGPKAHFLLKNFLPPVLATEILQESFFEDAASTRLEEIFEAIYNGNLFSDPIHKLRWTDFDTFLRSATIPKVERNTMLFSLEGRMPYLDNDILSLSIRTDSSLMVTRNDTKKCLKSLLKDKLPHRIVRGNPIKQGFSPPLVALFENELLSWKEHWLHAEMPFLKPSLSNVLARWRAKGWDFHRLEWNICVLGDWCYRNNLL